MRSDGVTSHFENATHANRLQAWFCLRSQPKHEHIAAGHLRQYHDVEVFNPRIRFTRQTRNGPALVTEALFPSYLFAKFNWRTSLNKVHYAPGIAGVVHFGQRWPTLPDEVVEELRELLGPNGVHEIQSDLAPGDTVSVAGGAFHGLEAVISQVLPGRQRVIVLMDFLGRQTSVELESSSVFKSRPLGPS